MAEWSTCEICAEPARRLQRLCDLHALDRVGGFFRIARLYVRDGSWTAVGREAGLSPHEAADAAIRVRTLFWRALPARQQRIGETVLLLGYPLSSLIGEQPTLTSGLVSAVRQVDGVLYLQTDAAMNPGNSGGAVVKARGKLVGLATKGITQAQGVNFAVATEEIAAFLQYPPDTSAANQIGPNLVREVQQAVIEYSRLEERAWAALQPEILRPRATAAWVQRKREEFVRAAQSGVVPNVQLIDAQFTAIRRVSPIKIELDLTEIWSIRFIDSRGQVVQTRRDTVPQTVVMVLEDCQWRLDDARF